MARIPANKQALILDTCASGAAAGDLTAARSVGSEMERAWERLKDRAGVYVLAGSAADRASYEASHVRQGLLTYALLEPLGRVDGSVLRRDGESFFVDVNRWFQHAEDRVPQLARELDLAGIQRPELKARRDARTFDVGMLMENDRGRIEIHQPRPVLLLEELEDQDKEDPLGLTARVGRALDGVDARGGERSVAYWTGVRQHPGAYRLKGDYESTGSRLEVEVFLQRYERGKDGLRAITVEKFRLTGSTEGVDDLVRRIVAEACARIEKRSPR